MAKKYLISCLAKKCCEILKASIKPENVFVVLEQAIQFDEKELEEKSWDIVLKETRKCLNSEAFCDIGLHTLNALLKKERLTVTEVELFKAVLKWTDSECARQGINIEEDKTARRRILGVTVYKIPLLQMSQEDIIKYVSPTGILTDTEAISILQKVLGLDVAGLKWKERRERQPAPILSFKRFDSEKVNVYNTPTMHYGGHSHALITLTVNKAVLFHGVRLFGSSGGSQYEVNFKLKDENVTGIYTPQQDSDGVLGYDVMLSKPISLLPNEEITVIATIKGRFPYWGGSKKSSVKVDNIVVTFKDAPSGLSSNGILTDKTKGQFYKVFLSKL